MRRSIRSGLATLAVLALATACASSVETTDVTPGDFGTPSDRGQDSDRNIQGTAIPEPSLEFGIVYFDFDKYDIRGDASPALRDNAETIRSHPDWRSVTIEGHCDERGSEEYNLALGERRAVAVRAYLVNLGVASSKLETVSFGEERPAVSGHDESSWKYNRRAEFGVNR